MAKKVFGKSDVGVWADGALGADHVRDKLEELMVMIGEDDLADELSQEPSDDLSEEDDVIEALNEVTRSGYSWGMVEGDLMLQSDKWWSEEAG